MRVGAPLLASLVVVACNKPEPSVCERPPSIQESLDARDSNPQEAPISYLRHGVFARECVHRWAYRLAASPDPAPTVAKAAVAACADAIDRWASAEFEYDAKSYRDPNPQMRSPNSDRLVSYHVGRREELTDLAGFRVVQARAGHCIAD